jgi:TPR repeat protein
VSFESGSGVAPDLERAVELYDQACKQGDSTGCVFLGEMYLAGRGAAASLELAAQFFQLACEHDPMGCLRYGEMLAAESDPDTNGRANEYFQMACMGGVQEACRRR